MQLDLQTCFTCRPGCPRGAQTHKIDPKSDQTRRLCLWGADRSIHMRFPEWAACGISRHFLGERRPLQDSFGGALGPQCQLWRGCGSSLSHSRGPVAQKISVVAARRCQRSCKKLLALSASRAPSRSDPASSSHPGVFLCRRAAQMPPASQVLGKIIARVSAATKRRVCTRVMQGPLQIKKSEE